jgi:hypothetical protein
MDETPFAVILTEMLRRMPGALAAAIVDFEGETVDYAGAMDPFDLKITAAHWRIALSHTLEQGFFSTLRWLIVRAAKRSYMIHRLPEDYALVIVLRRRAGFVPFARPISVCLRALAKEAAWPAPREKPPIWHGVRVETDHRHRPGRVHDGGDSFGVEVLGKVVGLQGKRERGWRVRLDSGKELTLVREPGGFWYADDEPR